MTLNAGELTERVTLYQSVSGVSTNGAPIEQVKKIGTAWAKVENAKTKTATEGDRERPLVGLQITMRWRAPCIAWIVRRGHWWRVENADDTDPSRTQLVLHVERAPHSPPPIQ